ncbi:MAG: hypothetical protein GY799_14215 [Desulfobulbaceae bacterium]|nr:hypothetical protein [Desulfobulbaceae bacterium]
MSVSLEIKETDNSRFVEIVETMINRLDNQYYPEDIYVIRIRGWFDHKWLNFSGIGRVPFDSPFPDHPQVAIEEFFQDKTTFPPFTPKRILSQESWILNDQKKRTQLPHKYKKGQSAKNLNKRVKDHSKSALYIWYSSASDENKRGSVMIYHCDHNMIITWYSSFIFDAFWKINKTKGINKDFVKKLSSIPHSKMNLQKNAGTK